MPERKIKAILFDVDGTLVNSIPYHNQSFIQLFSDLGIKLPRKKIMSVMRMPTEEIYVRLKVKKLCGLNLQPFIKIRRKYYYRLIKRKKIVFPGVYKTLGKLKKKYKLAIVTNSSRTTTRKQCPRKLLSFFDLILTFDNVKRGKPNPEIVRKALKILKVKPNEALFIGDSKFDVIAANELSIKFIGLTTGVSTRKSLEENGAHIVLKRFSQIENFIKKIYRH